MKTLEIDLETYSDVDIGKCGLYRYSESDAFEVLLFACSADGGPVELYDLASGDRLPDSIIAALTDETVLKLSHNAAFERVCLSRFLGLPKGEFLDPRQWRCTMVWASALGLPLSLDGVGVVLGLEKRKMGEGKALIRHFCSPVNGHRNMPEDFPEKWETFKAYNIRDVEVEHQIYERLSRYPLPDRLWDEYHIDQVINDRGILIDMDLADAAVAMDMESRAEITERMAALTELANPNSTQQLKAWLSEHSMDVESLGRKDVEALVKAAPEDIREVLQLRLMLARSSIKKYMVMQKAACSDRRARGMFQFYGASRTGRWSGRLLQLQNLRRNSLIDLDAARNLVLSGDHGAVKMLYDDVPDTLSQLVRTAFIPEPGHYFVVADYSAVEARALAWLAGEQWRLDAFNEGKDLYCESASMMFGVPVVKHGINGDLRQKGKVAELACIAEDEMVLTDRGLVRIQDVHPMDLLWDGEDWVQHGGVVCNGIREVISYGGLRATPDHRVWTLSSDEPVPLCEAAARGLTLRHAGARPSGRRRKGGRTRVYDILDAGPRHRFTVSGVLVHNCGYGGGEGALKAMGALDMGLREEELPGIISSWRDASPRIVEYWWAVDKAAKKAIRERCKVKLGNLVFEHSSGMLFITLPSGRRLAYVKPRLVMGRFAREVISYEGQGATKKWERIETYGPKLCENITQAVCRDLLAHSMGELEREGFRIVAHIHDEVIIEGQDGVLLADAIEVMERTPKWARGLPLRADGYVCGYYRKD